MSVELIDPPLDLAPFEAHPAPAGGMRVLVASQGHPLIVKGGSEVAAYRLFRELAATPGCETWFLGCRRDRPDRQSAISQPFSDREFIYAAADFDWFTFANRDPNFSGALERLIDELAPDLIHFHHYANFGVEAFHIVKRAAPRTQIVLTLHEYQAICAHYGQMITREHRHLCHRASPLDCGRCFPEYDQSRFFVRERYIKRFLDEVDHFIAPSRFLMGRYVAWGLPEAKITSIPDVIGYPIESSDGSGRAPEGPFKVGFFGQLSFLKGINVLLETARLIEAGGNREIVIEIHGDDRSLPLEIRAEFASEIATASGNVRYLGAYDETQVDALMRGVDAVVVPSIWWENRPLVIQEALRNRRPVICSGIGGMAETVRDGIDGIHFPVGNADALARLLERLAADPARLAAMRDGIRVPPAPAAVTERHIALYKRLLTGVERI